MNDKGYVNIQGWMINNLGLTGNKLILFALIFGFSQDGVSKFRGSGSYIASALNISRRTAINLLKELLKDKYITKEKNNTGNLYCAEISLLKSKGVKKLHSESEEVAQVSSAETSHNIYNPKDKDNNKKNQDSVSQLSFDKLRVNYKTILKGKTRGLDTEFSNASKKHNLTAELIERMSAGAKAMYLEKKEQYPDGDFQFVPMFQTFINQSKWEEYEKQHLSSCNCSCLIVCQVY